MKILFHGNDNFLSLQEVHNYLNKIASDNLNERKIIDCSITSVDEIISNISTENLFSQTQVFVLKRLIENKGKEKVITYLLENFDKLNNSSYYIFWESQKVPSNTKYYKLFKNDLFEFNQMNKPAFYNWVKEQLEQSSIKADRQTIIFLSNRVNFSTERLKNEIEKYKLNNVETLTQETVENLTADTLENQIWDLTDSINNSNKQLSFDILNNLYRQEVDPNFILAIVARNIRLITQVKDLESQGKTSKDICTRLKIPPFTLPSLLSIARKSDWSKIKYIYEKIASLDFEIKIGNIDPKTGLTLLLTKI